ncbi:hypothetical protein KNV00_gp155 [Streptomyces phage Bmoc]|uniref:Uncharacterized protein n=1 Tax=Streptomyces phage Bmoc TaxID=2725629 RepID=A0A6M3TAR8_9CAUD|nr:hypothetical protein KNV00_gp155 [Streptomyces phage Bmoc]QJD50864.1 hypothetical protein SEA_BMOC_126 [Streptomyces phage Bmoc]
MKNWLGHDIVVGAVVFRGGRQGDSSSFRVGEVDAIDETKRTARVIWHWVPCQRPVWDSDQYEYWHQDDNRYYVEGPSEAHTQKTRYNINDLVRLDDETLERLNKRHKLIKAAIHYKIRKEDFAQFEHDFEMGLIPEYSMP